jgi:hypothetical protein
MHSRWTWPALVACLLILGALLAMADAALLRPLLPPPEPPRQFGPDGRPPVLPRVVVGPGLLFGWGFRGRELDFGYGGLVSTAVVVLLLCLAMLVALPGRVRVAVERLEAPRGMLRAYGAGAAAALMVAAITLLFRYTFLLIGIAPLLWLAAGLATVFGLACLSLYMGRRLARRLGATHPLLAALAGILLILDVALVPYLGWLFAAAAALVGLGLAAMTRFGSPRGWSLEELRWQPDTTPLEEA